MESIEGNSPPRFGRIAKLKGFLPLSEDSSLLTTHGSGALSSLLSNGSLNTLSSLPSLAYGDIESGSPEWSHTTRAENRRLSAVLNGPQMRSQRLIGKSNPRYRWERYWKTEEELKGLKKPIKQYYQRNNWLIQQYVYIDRLLDSSLPHDLLNEYTDTVPDGQTSSSGVVDIPPIISEETCKSSGPPDSTSIGTQTKKVKRTPRDIYTVSNENTPLLFEEDEDRSDVPKPDIPEIENETVESGDEIVKLAIHLNLIANAILLTGKIAVIVLTSSLSVLASLVDAALDFLSTAIVWTTTKMIEYQDIYQYPVGRRRLEPIGVLVFSVVMMVSFIQVALECLSRLGSDDHAMIELGLPAIIIMASTVVIKALCWLWCRLIKNSSVQALAQDAMTDVIFNIFSIIFPLVGFYAKLWWLDGLGGLLLSLYVIFNWAGTSAAHIKNLTGQAATADERNVLLYLTMRFATTIKQVQGLQAYHAGDKLNVEVDIVLDQNISLKDSHDLAESLQYVLESVPTVDRAFVHTDYTRKNLPTHMAQQDG